MRINRRNVLIGLGAAGVTGGIAFGTGAFTSVDADRDLEVQVTTDNPDDDPLISIFGRFVEYDDGIAEFVIEDGTLDNAQGLNPDAVTTFEDVLRLRIEDGSKGPYDVTFDDADNLVSEGLHFSPNDATAGDPADNSGYPVEIEAVGVGEEVVLDIEIDSDEGDVNETLEGELHIEIESQ